MVIDFHTHVFPDKIASKTIEALERAASVAKAHTDGTLKGLLESMRLSGIDRSVILPVATRKGQFDTINRFALEINEKYPNLLSFGGIHPDDDDIEGKTAYLKDKGFRGIKIHPDYTGVFIDDERYINIISSAARNGMLTVTHAGGKLKMPNLTGGITIMCAIPISYIMLSKKKPQIDNTTVVGLKTVEI